MQLFLATSSLEAYRTKVISKQLYPTTERRKFNPIETGYLSRYSDGTAGWATDKSGFYSLQRQETSLLSTAYGVKLSDWIKNALSYTSTPP
jgi:hypothetical protein